MPQTWELSLDAFPVGQLKIPLAPLRSVVSVKYADTNGAEQTLSPTAYEVDSTSEPGRLALASGQSWPATLVGLNSVRIRFDCGYASVGDIPANLIAAMLLHVEALFDGNNIEEVGAYDRLVFPHRMNLIG
jgi:uncharacterized phiE125 gp8 family phage protein